MPGTYHSSSSYVKHYRISLQLGNGSREPYKQSTDRLLSGTKRGRNLDATGTQGKALGGFIWLYCMLSGGVDQIYTALFLDNETEAVLS